jgi:predicted unusual protein kinase regulating ubiquinone biosynthesis (AarF/ABC1/UbiB family)
VDAFVQAGTLLPGANLDRLEAAHAAFLDRFWGVTVGNLKTTAQAEARAFLREFQDIVRQAPFQFQVDMLFILRAVGMLSGLAAHLDPEFDVWSRTLPYARRYAREALHPGSRRRLEEVVGGLRQLLELPDQLHRVVKQTASRGLPVRSRWDESVHQRFEGLRRNIRRLERTVLAGSCLIAGAILLACHPEALSGKLLMAGAVVLLILRRGG